MHLCGATLLPLRVILLQYHPKSGETRQGDRKREKKEEGKMCWKGTSKLNGLLAGV